MFSAWEMRHLITSVMPISARSAHARQIGESWEDLITQAMERCTTFVVLGTRTYGMCIPCTVPRVTVCGALLRHEALL